MPEIETPPFVDSNVWLYALINDKSSSNKQAIAKQLIQHQPTIVSTQVVREVCRNLLKKGGYTEAEIVQAIETFYYDHQVVQDSIAVELDASRLRQVYSLSYWDSLIVSAALTTDASILLSEDMHDGLVVDGRLTIHNPFSA